MLKKILQNRHTPFWLITASVLVGVTLPTLIQDGMFMDGMLYTSVSHNLSMGIGTFWFPQFSIHNVAGLPSFHEQPPLVFGIQAIFYKIFGDSMYVERFYTFFTMCVTAILINLLWKEIFKDEKDLKEFGWLPILLWITIPVCFWSYSNNMHENTLSIFTLAAVLIIYKSFSNEKRQVVLWILSGIFIFLATLSKGLPGFFPIIVPFLYWLIIKKNTFQRIFIQTLSIALVPIIFYTILFFIPESNESLSTYLFERALLRINEVPTVDSRFWILYRLFMELLPQIIMMTVVLFIAKLKKIQFPVSEQFRQALFFVSVGLSASLPLMITLVQKGFYLVPSLPFFAIGFSILVAPFIFRFTARINLQNKKYKLFLLLSLFLFIGTDTFALLQKGKVSRNKELLHDVYVIGTVVPRQSTVSIPAEMWNEWDLQCYLVRYFNISLDPNYQNKYCIINKSTPTEALKGYKKIDIATLQLDLYKR